MSARSRSLPPGALPALLLVLIALPGIAMAQIGTAPNGDPGGFGIDGELEPGTPVGGTSDWLTHIMNNGTPTSSSTVHGVDAYNNSDLIFSTNSCRHFNNPNSDWFWDTPGMEPLGGKENFANGVAHFSLDGSGHTWFTWAVDREGGGGESYMDVALYQGTLVRNGNGSFSSSGPHGGHTLGDLLLSLDLLDPGTVLSVWRWSEVGPGVYDFTALTPGSGTFFSAINVEEATVPYKAFGVGFYQPERFAEASLDLTALLTGIQPPTHYRTVFFVSRLGQSIGSVLRDFIEPIPMMFTTGVPEGQVRGARGIVAVSPNPSRGPVTIEFELAETRSLTLEVFDLAGRRVGAPMTGTFPAGRHTLRWDPGVTNGLRRAEVFHARLTGGGVTDSRRFVVVR